VLPGSEWTLIKVWEPGRRRARGHEPDYGFVTIHDILCTSPMGRVLGTRCWMGSWLRRTLAQSLLYLKRQKLLIKKGYRIL
jgi:hypothetical protein